MHNSSSNKLLSILKKTVKAQSTTKISREDFEIQDYFYFFIYDQ